MFAKLSGTLTLTLHGITETTLDLSCTDEEAVLRFKTIKGLTGDSPKPRRRKDAEPDTTGVVGESPVDDLTHPTRATGTTERG